jgi:transcriptional regulator with XRE-family HTH domain
MSTNSKHPIKQFRECHNLALSDLAVILNVSGSFIAQIESNFAPIPEIMLNRFCEYFKLDQNKVSKEIDIYKSNHKQRVLDQLANPSVPI